MPLFASAQPQIFTFEQGVDTYAGFEDTTIFSESDNSGGGTPAIFSGTINNLTFEGDTQDRRALIRVDLTSIPTDWFASTVSLRLSVESSGANFGDIDYSLHRVTRAWGEGTVVGASEGGFGSPADDGDATWAASEHNVAIWTLPGGDFVAEASATAIAGTVGSDIVWTGPGLIEDVQDWIDNPASNHGWIVIGALEGTRQRVKRFYSSEAADFRPVLTVRASRTPTALPTQSHPVAAIILACAFVAIGALALRRSRTARP